MIKVQTVGSDSQLVPRFFKDFFYVRDSRYFSYFKINLIWRLGV